MTSQRKNSSRDATGRRSAGAAPAGRTGWETTAPVMVDASRRKAALATRLGARAHRLDRLVAADLIVRWFAAASGAEAADAARAYAGRADATLRRYRHERHRLYAGEGRWADRPFWQRRL